MDESRIQEAQEFVAREGNAVLDREYMRTLVRDLLSLLAPADGDLLARVPYQSDGDVQEQALSIVQEWETTMHSAFDHDAARQNLVERIAAALTARPAGDGEPTVPSDARLRNQAENIVFAALGYPASADIDVQDYSRLVEGICAALKVAHIATTSGELTANIEQVAQRVAAIICPASAICDFKEQQKKIADIIIAAFNDAGKGAINSKEVDQ